MDYQLKLLRDLAESAGAIILKEAKRPAEKRKWSGLPTALEIVQKVLVDGSLKNDFLGRPECKSFVLNENPDPGNESANLFGSANIEAWIQLQLFNKVRG